MRLHHVLKLSAVGFTSLLFLMGCGDASTQSTDHYTITFLNMKITQQANQNADFQFQIKTKGNAQEPKSIILDFDNVDMDHGKNEVTASQMSDGKYEGVTKLPMGGKWNVTVHIGDENVQFPFQAEGGMSDQ